MSASVLRERARNAQWLRQPSWLLPPKRAHFAGSAARLARGIAFAPSCAMGRLATNLGARFTRGVERAVGRYLLRRFEHASASCAELNRETLREILARNASSERGEQYGFREILRAPDFESAFREAIPLTTWDDYIAATERMAQGFQNVLCSDPIRNFALSSGTTGLPKTVPVTKHQYVSMVMNMACLVPTLAELDLKARGRAPTSSAARDISLMSFAGTEKRTAGGTPIGSGSGSGMRGMAPMIPFIWCSPAHVFGLEDQRAANYLHALFGLRERTVRSVQAIFAPHALEWLRGIELHFPSLLRDIAEGTISEALALEPAMRVLLERELVPEPARARELEQAASLGFQDVLSRFWPELSFVGTCISGSFAQYHEPLLRYTGKVPIFSPIYAASESMIGQGLWLDEANRYVLCVGASHFEFIPLSQCEMACPETVLPSDLSEGEAYEVVLTNRAGLYRYRLGDVVRMVGRHKSAPIMQFEYRRGTQLDLVGEKTTEAQTRAAVRAFASAWLGREVTDYTLRPDIDHSPPRYVVYVELSGRSERIDARELERGARVLDAALTDANPRYGAYARARGRVAAPLLVLIAQGGFAALERALSQRSGLNNKNQVKIPRLLRDPDLVSVLERHATAHVSQAPSIHPSSRFPSASGSR